MICGVILSNKLKCVFAVCLLQVHYDASCKFTRHVAQLQDYKSVIRMTAKVGDARWRERAQLMACWWPDCSGPAAHWAVIATAGASGTDSSGTPIAQSWHLPLSTVCPDQPLTMPFVLTDGKTEVSNQPISSSTDLSFLFSPSAHPSIIFSLTYILLCVCLLLSPALLSFPSSCLLVSSTFLFSERNPLPFFVCVFFF